MTSFRGALRVIAFSTIASASHAASITLEDTTTSIEVNAKVTEVPAPISGGEGDVVSTGQIWSGGKSLSAIFQDRFIAWCFDLIHPIGLGQTLEYEVVDTPYSNSYLLAGADDRVSKLFNANYGNLDPYDTIQAAGFQLAVWEVANDDDFKIDQGIFQAAGLGSNADEITKVAQSFLTDSESFTGPLEWQAFFLETREKSATQNLVTAVAVSDLAPVPIPASGLFLIAGVTGLLVYQRRRPMAAKRS